MKLALIISNGRIARWQADALRSLRDAGVILILNCQNTRSKRDLRKNLLYYVLNLAAIRNWKTRGEPFDSQEAEWIDFESTYKGAWQVLPDNVIARIADSQVDVVVKFGMSLLVVPEDDVLPTPILSYHHGDPEAYRGRPAAFYEMLHNADYVGVMVQQITNRLDAGTVYAFGEARIVKHSYRKTLIGAYEASSHLLEKALSALREERPLDKPPTGKNYTLPSNRIVARFLLQRAANLIRRGFEVAFLEKHWQVSVSGSTKFQSLIDGQEPHDKTTLAFDNRFAFYADPFFLDEKQIIVEAASRQTGVGQLVLVGPGGHTELTTRTRHFSYPCVIRNDGRVFILPETAQWSSPQIYPLKDGRLENPIPLAFSEHTRIVDPTHFAYDGNHYLFGSRRGDNGSLFLWYSQDLEGPYIEHPSNPICLSPRGARMAGNIVLDGQRMLRIGQNSCRGYGDGIFIREITELSTNRYSESLIGEFRLSDRKGPHTVNVMKDSMVWDWYVDRFSLFAWLRRLSRISVGTLVLQRISRSVT